MLDAAQCCGLSGFLVQQLEKESVVGSSVSAAGYPRGHTCLAAHGLNGCNPHGVTPSASSDT